LIIKNYHVKTDTFNEIYHSFAALVIEDIFSVSMKIIQVPRLVIRGTFCYYVHSGGSV